MTDEAFNKSKYLLCVLSLLILFTGCSNKFSEDYSTKMKELTDENINDPLITDRFGGWSNAPFIEEPLDANGFFRTEKIDGVWWFVTPDGNPFLSKGVTDVNWFGADLDEKLFQHHLIDKYGTEPVWIENTVERLNNWGFNTAGPWSSYSLFPEVPYSAIILDMGGHSPRYPDSPVADYWSSDFINFCLSSAQRNCVPVANNENILGYFLDNELIWGPDHYANNKTMLQIYMEFPKNASGRKQAVSFLKDSTESVEEFNHIWKTKITTWDEVDNLPGKIFSRKRGEAVDIAEQFMIKVFDQYATVSINAVRVFDENHLILGCRFHTYPGDTLIYAAEKHFDVISMAYYEKNPPVKDLDKIAQNVEVPFLIGEWTFKSSDSGLLNRGIYAPRVKTQHERSLAYMNYVQEFMSRPYAVGFHWYKWFDNPKREGKPFAADNCGLLNEKDVPYDQFVDFIAQVNRRVEIWHLNGE